MICGAIVFGYLSDSLPDSYFNEADRAIITSWQNSKVSRIVGPVSLSSLFFAQESGEEMSVDGHRDRISQASDESEAHRSPFKVHTLPE